MIAATLAAFALLSLADIPAILRRRDARLLTVYLAVFVPALALALLIAAGIKVPSAMEALGMLFEQIFGKVYPP